MEEHMRTLPTQTKHLLAHLQDRTLILTMNRPDVRNALSQDMLDAMAEQLAKAEIDDGIGCIVLTGAAGAFCAGGDVTDMATARQQASSSSQLQAQRHMQRATAGALFSMPKPTIAAINGPAAGAGLSLALACDLRTMAAETFLTTAFAKVGLSGDFGGTYFLSQIVGTAKARELFYLSDRVSAAEALHLGIVGGLHRSDILLAATLNLARRLAAGPGIALGLMKENLNRALLSPFTECLDMEAAAHIACLGTHDHREAAAAFVEKRMPRFKGC